MPTTAPAPAEPATRVSFAQAARHSDTAAPSVLDRILTPRQRASVEVAAFQSSV